MSWKHFLPCLLLLALWASHITADPSDPPPTPAGLTVLQLAADDHRAVIKLADGELRLVAPGDSVTLPSSELTAVQPGSQDPVLGPGLEPEPTMIIVEVLADRLLIELIEPRSSLQSRRGWVYPPSEGGQPSRVDWLDPLAPPAPDVANPSFLEIPAGDDYVLEEARRVTSEPPARAAPGTETSPRDSQQLNPDQDQEPSS